MKRDYIYIAIILLALGAGVFGTIKYGKENRKLRREMKQSEQREKRAMASFDSLMTSVSQRDKEDSVRAIKDSVLSARLTDYSKRIATLNETRNIHTLPANEFLSLFSGYIDSAAAR